MEAEPEYRWQSSVYECTRLLQEFPVAYPFRSRIFRSTFMVQHFPFCQQIELYCVAEPGQRALLVDTGHPDLCGREALDGVSTILGVPWEATEVFLTHFHDDHDANLPYCQLKGAPLAYTPVAPSDAQGMIVTFLEQSDAFDLAQRNVFPYTNLVAGGKEMVAQTRGWRKEVQGGEEIVIAGYAFEALHTPGHTDNHMCLLNRSKRILFAGDHICDVPPGFMQFGIDQHLVGRYLESLKQLKGMNLKTVFMCHHNPLNGTGQINTFLSLLEGRNETLAEKTRRLFDGGEELTVRQAAVKVADHYPKGLEGFPPSVQVARIARVFASLEYLFDVGFLGRAFNDAGALVYGLR